jgi:hypothetical protein
VVRDLWLHPLSIIVLFGIKHSLILVIQIPSSRPELVGFDLMSLSHAPLRFYEALSASAIMVSALIVSVFFRRIRIRWIEIPARILTGMLLLVLAFHSLYIFQHGIAWPNGNAKMPFPLWFFCKPADLCFLAALLCVIILGIVLSDKCAHRILPNPRVHPAGAKGTSAPGG